MGANARLYTITSPKYPVQNAECPPRTDTGMVCVAGVENELVAMGVGGYVSVLPLCSYT